MAIESSRDWSMSRQRLMTRAYGVACEPAILSRRCTGRQADRQTPTLAQRLNSDAEADEANKFSAEIRSSPCHHLIDASIRVAQGTGHKAPA